MGGKVRGARGKGRESGMEKGREGKFRGPGPPNVFLEPRLREGKERRGRGGRGKGRGSPPYQTALDPTMTTVGIS